MFYINIDVCIEVDGKQHFIPATFGGMSKKEANNKFNEGIERDNIKNKFCKDNGIKLIRLSYKMFNKNNDYIKILNKELNL